MQWPISGLGCFFHTRGSDYDNLYKIVISNTFRQFKIDTKCHLVNVWSNFDLVILRYINNKKKTWSAQIYFSKSFFSRVNTFLEKLYVFLCAHVLRPVCARTRTQLRGNIGPKPFENALDYSRIIQKHIWTYVIRQTYTIKAVRFWTHGLIYSTRYYRFAIILHRRIRTVKFLR